MEVILLLLLLLYYIYYYYYYLLLLLCNCCTMNFLLGSKLLEYTCLMHNFKTICTRWFSVMLTPVAKQDNPDHITIYHLDTWCQGNIKPIRANPKLQILLLSSPHSQALFECREHKQCNHINFILIPEKIQF